MVHVWPPPGKVSRKFSEFLITTLSLEFDRGCYSKCLLFQKVERYAQASRFSHQFAATSCTASTDPRSIAFCQSHAHFGSTALLEWALACERLQSGRLSESISPESPRTRFRQPRPCDIRILHKRNSNDSLRLLRRAIPLLGDPRSRFGWTRKGRPETILHLLLWFRESALDPTG